ncbi:MAG: Twitching motility protein PilT, partial [uncultured Thiotrichaceae bacterium]
AIRNLIRENKIAQMRSTLQTSQGEGMQTLDQSLKSLVMKGEVERDVARHKADNPDAI